jgi:hypothetical protein
MAKTVSNEVKYIVRTIESWSTKTGKFRSFQYDDFFTSEKAAREGLFHQTRGHETLYPSIRRRDLFRVEEGKDIYLGCIHSRHYNREFAATGSKVKR